jgi:hypothetical protein
MWPNLYMDKASRPITVGESPLHKIAEKIAKELLGEDMEFDFDMLISKVRNESKTRHLDRNRKKHTEKRKIEHRKLFPQLSPSKSKKKS